MKITAETELMKNQKHADVMAPDMAFEVIQTPEGDALFFSIGTDRVFYVTREIRETQTGWSRVDLSSTLSSQHGNVAVTAKSFSISQNAQTMQFDAALIITVAGADFLYLSLNHPNTADAWASGVTWTVIPFDAAKVTAPKLLTIADVYLMNIPSTDSFYSIRCCREVHCQSLENKGYPSRRWFRQDRSNHNCGITCGVVHYSIHQITTCLGSFICKRCYVS
jgi:hypothetical protein